MQLRGQKHVVSVSRTDHLDLSTRFLAQLTPLRTPRNVGPMLYNAFQLVRHPKVPLGMGASARYVLIHGSLDVPAPTRFVVISRLTSSA